MVCFEACSGFDKSGSVAFSKCDGASAPPRTSSALALFDRGDEITVQAGEAGIRFLLVSGRPLQEPVAWRGPIVMNTNEELQRAYAEIRAGTFIQGR
jgi:redox-sensitive bicupin YhaK (pirin superfamily)